MFDRSIPFLGFHTILHKHEGVEGLLRVIEEVMVPEGLNTLVLEMRYQFECFPQYAAGTVTKEDAGRIADLCEKHGIRLVPLLPCLGHQSMDPPGTPLPILQDHPEFMETPDVDPNATWPDIYHHSWCASNDGIYDYIFPMIDELIEVCRAGAFHVGLDEVFDIAMCPRCRDKSPAELFARTVKILHDHLAQKNIDMMMWGDRLLDSLKMGYQMWEGDRFGMHGALHRKDQVTRDIILCDWHYDHHSAGYPSVETFIKEGFFVAPSVFHVPDNAEHFWTHALEAQYLSKRYRWDGQLGGILFTNWQPMTDDLAQDLIDAYHGKPSDGGWGGLAVGAVIRRMHDRVQRFHL